MSGARLARCVIHDLPASDKQKIQFPLSRRCVRTPTLLAFSFGNSMNSAGKFTLSLAGLAKKFSGESDHEENHPKYSAVHYQHAGQQYYLILQKL
jgi:hypothetical protein